MCSYAEQKQRDNMCWCFEEITLMLLVQRILMYLWYRLLLKMFPRLSVLPSCHECSPRRSLPCGQLADEYWKASYFSRTLQQGRLCDNKLKQAFPPAGFCNHMEPICGGMDLFEQQQQPQDDEEMEEFNFNCSDISHIYQSTFLDEYDDEDECFLAKDIAWDAPVPETKERKIPLEEEISLLLNDYYIDDDLDDHLQMADYQTAIGDSMFCTSFIE